MDPREIEEYLTRRLQAAPFEEAPFPHLFIDNVFPDEFYRELRSNFPTEDEFIGHDGYRFTFSVEERDFSRLSAPKRAFWREFSG